MPAEVAQQYAGILQKMYWRIMMKCSEMMLCTYATDSLKLWCKSGAQGPCFQGVLGQRWAAYRRSHLSPCGCGPSLASSELDLEGRPRGRATSFSCSLRWQGSQRIPRQGAPSRSHELNIRRAALPDKWRHRRACTASSSSQSQASDSNGEESAILWGFMSSVCVCAFMPEDTHRVHYVSLEALWVDHPLVTE